MVTRVSPARPIGSAIAPHAALLATLALLAASAAATSAHASPGDRVDPRERYWSSVAGRLERAREARAALRYREAMVIVEAALGLGKAMPDELAALYRLGGELQAGLDEPAQAQRWFARWLALEPDGQLPADTSPKLTAPLAAARAQLGGRGLELTVGLSGTDPGRVTVLVAHDPLGFVHEVRIRTDDGDARSYGLAATPGRSLSVPVRGDHAAVAFDALGNALRVVPFSIERAVPTAPPLHARWQPYALAAGAFAITGGVFAWRTAVAQDEFDRLRADSTNHTFAELEAVRTRGERYQLVAGIAIGAAALSTLAATYFHLTDPRARPPRLVLGASLAPAHAGLAISGGF